MSESFLTEDEDNPSENSSFVKDNLTEDLSEIASSAEWSCLDEGERYAEFSDGEGFYRVQVLRASGPKLGDLREVYEEEGIEDVREMLQDTGFEVVHTFYSPNSKNSPENGFERVESMPEGYFQKVEELSEEYSELF